MEVNRRLFFGFLGGAAASSKSIALKAEEAFRNVKMKEAFDSAVGLAQRGMYEDASASKSESPYVDKHSTIEFWKNKLLKLNSDDRPKNTFLLASKRKLEIEGLRSVSYVHKLNMSNNVELFFEKEREERSIFQSIKNIAAGRPYYDDGDDK